MKRITTIVLVVSLLLFGLSSFAASDGGLVVKNWYDRVSEQAMEDVASKYISEMTRMNETVSQEEKNQLTEAGDLIDILSANIFGGSGVEVEKYQKRYIEVAEETEKQLKGKNFSTLEAQELQKLESELEADAAAILADVLK